MVDDRDATVHWEIGRALYLRWRWDESEVEFKPSAELSPNFALGHYNLSVRLHACTSLFLAVERTFVFLLDGGAIHAFDKCVGIGETCSANHRYHSKDTAHNPPRAYRYHIWIPAFTHRDLPFLTTIMPSW